MAKRSLREMNKFEEEETEEEEGEEEEEEEVVERKKRASIRVSRERKVVSPGSSQSVCCQADNCDWDLSVAKRYHRRHKVCERHAKAAVVLVGGVDQRYCQQCSRFHEISQFDDTKRSCRKRLAGHNERRRKTHPDIQAEDAGHKAPIPNMKGSSWRASGLPERMQMALQRNANFKHFQIR